MENNKETLKKYYEDIMKIINGRNDTQPQYRDSIDYNYTNQDLYQKVYKIPLYSFKDGSKPYCVDDDNFANVFNLMGILLVTIVDCNHVKEIKTGKIIPIVHLIKENDYWTSSHVKCDSLKDDDILFTISRNEFLFPYQINIRDLNTYLGMENKDLEALFSKWENYNKPNIKIKK